MAYSGENEVSMFSHFKKSLTAVMALSLAGMLVSAYATYQHYRPSGTSFCNVNEYVSCDIVNQSEYSEILGIPIGGIGMAGYGLFFFIALGLYRGWFKNILRATVALALFSAAGLLFSLGLTSIEFFILFAVCPVCIVSQILILIIFILSLHIWLKLSKSSAAYS